jgi:hypothetical protein
MEETTFTRMTAPPDPDIHAGIVNMVRKSGKLVAGAVKIVLDPASVTV